MKSIVFKHHYCTLNLGDRICSPFDYFPALASRSIRLDLSKQTPPCEAVIYGGGKIMGGLAKKIGFNDRAARLRIAWGVSTVQSSRIAPHYWRAYKQMSLIGTRDWNDSRFDWSPCVTCLSPNFDIAHVEKHEIVAYLHHWRSADRRFEIPNDIPVMENIETDFSKVVRFLASGRIVVSNSYHGVYWALLLGKRVLCVPFSNKFYYYRFPPGFSSGSRWRRELHLARGNPEMLGHCREAALSFAAKATSYIESYCT